MYKNLLKKFCPVFSEGIIKIVVPESCYHEAQYLKERGYELRLFG